MVTKSEIVHNVVSSKRPPPTAPAPGVTHPRRVQAYSPVQGLQEGKPMYSWLESMRVVCGCIQ